MKWMSKRKINVYLAKQIDMRWIIALKVNAETIILTENKIFGTIFVNCVRTFSKDTRSIISEMKYDKTGFHQNQIFSLLKLLRE